MRAIDGDELIDKYGEWYTEEGTEAGYIGTIKGIVDSMPTIEERKKDTIQKFHDYQVEWLLSHCDLELEPQLEEWIVRFLHDTANCYMMEIDREEGDHS